MKWRHLIFANLIAMGIFSHKAAPAIVIGEGRWNLGGGPAVYGWQFSVNAPMRVNAIGLYDGSSPFDGGFPGDGLGESHTIGIWRAVATQTPLATAQIPSPAQRRPSTLASDTSPSVRSI